MKTKHYPKAITKAFMLILLAILAVGCTNPKGNDNNTTASEKSKENESQTVASNENAPKPTSSCLFTINGNGDQVYFSPGNLQYQASTNTWRFAENQWDRIGDANANISSSYDGWIDLFAWGTSGYDHGAVCFQPWSTSNDEDSYHVYGNEDFNLNDGTGKADWGCNAISNGGNQENQWRVLSRDEWEYVIKNRPTASGVRYAKAQVNGVTGAIIMPDDWSESYYNIVNTNQWNASYSSNSITADAWKNIFEPAGCAFLPAAGFRTVTTVNYLGESGVYWSSTCNYDIYAFILSITKEDLDFGGFGRMNGAAVRLVRSR